MRGFVQYPHSLIRNFSIDGIDIEMYSKKIINEKIDVRATEFWYNKAFESSDKQTPQYTKLLRKIARESHRDHPLTIYLAPLFAIMWRMNPEKSFKIKNLMDWCSLDHHGRKRTENLKNLESELNYMKSAGYVGDWKNNGGKILPSQCQNPFDCVIQVTPPEWLKSQIKEIESRREQHLLNITEAFQSQQKVLTHDQFTNIFNKSGLSIRQFANHLGLSATMISQIMKGNRNITPKTSRKIKEVFGHLLKD